MLFMMLKIEKDRAQKFIKLYEDYFDEILTEGEAEMMIRQLVLFLYEIGQKLPGEEDNQNSDN